MKSLGVLRGRIPIRLVAAVLGATSVFAAGVARAQNFEGVPLGGRTATMGGAATAAGNDSAMPYLNPAGLAGLPGDVLGVSADLHAYSTRNFGTSSFFFSGGLPKAFGNANITQNKVDSSGLLDFPTSLVFARHLSPATAEVRHVVALSLMTPVSQITNISAAFNAAFPKTDDGLQQSSTGQTSVTHQYIGPSYAVAIGDRVRFGISAYAVLRTESLTVQAASNAVTNDGAETSSTNRQRSVTATGWAFVPIVGMQLRLTKRLYFGAGFAPPSIPLAFGDSYIESGELDTSDTDPKTGRPLDGTNSTTATGHYRVGLPMRINAGIAYENPNGFSLAVDAKYYGPRYDGVHTDLVRETVNYSSGEVGRDFMSAASRQVNFKPVLNLAIGAELTVTKGIGVRLGAFTDLVPTAQQPITADDLYTVRENRFGVTTGVGFKFGSFETTVGLYYAHTDGTFFGSNATNPRELSVVPISTTSDTFGLVFSGAMNTEEILKKLKSMIPIGSAADILDMSCPDMSTPEAIAKMDWATEFGVSSTSASTLRAGIGAAVDLARMGSDFTTHIADVCGDFARDLGGDPPKDVGGACKEAASRIGSAVLALKDAGVSVQVGKPSCETKTTLEACMATCSSGPVACEASCAIAVAQSLECTPPSVDVKLSPGIQGAIKVEQALQRDVPRLVRIVVGLVPAVRKAVEGAQRLFGVAQEAVSAAARGGLKTAAKIAVCLAGPLKNALSSVGAIKDALEAGAAVKAQVDAVGDRNERHRQEDGRRRCGDGDRDARGVRRRPARGRDRMQLHRGLHAHHGVQHPDQHLRPHAGERGDWPLRLHDSR